MKKFLIHICLFSSLLFAASVVFEFMLRQVPNSYKFKQELIEQNGDKIKNLVIGSSVTNCSFNPAYFADSTYNLSVSGQWVRYNHIMLKRYIEQLPHLKNVIWGISYHTLWFDDGVELDKGSVAYHKIYMDVEKDKDLPYNIELIATGSIAFRKWSKHYIVHKRTMNCDSLGLDHSFDSSERSPAWLEDIPQSLKTHASHYQNAEKILEENIRRLNEAAEWCHDKGIRLSFVIPPVHKKYYELTDSSQTKLMHATLEEIATRWDNVRVYSYFNDNRFDGTYDFHSGNHLSSDIGAPKFTQILRQDMARSDSLWAR